MDSFEAMLTRRSIRSYTDAPVEDAKVDMLLRAAMSAPSAGNQQPWRFVVVQDAEVRAALADASQFAKMLPRAPLAIVVCAATEGLKHPDYWMQDCAAATQNLLIAARTLGLGAVWCGFYPNESRVQGAREALGIADDRVVPFSVVSLGYPAEQKDRADRFREDFVRRDRW